MSITQPQKFKRHKTIDEIEKQGLEAGYIVDRNRYDKSGSDFIVIYMNDEDPPMRVFWNTFNGQFFGQRADGVEFDETSKLDGEPWYDAILNFFFSKD